MATLVSYRRPGHRRGSPYQALLPGRVESTGIAEDLLTAVVGEVEQVRIVQVIARAGVFEAHPDALPEPLVIPGLRTIAKPSDGFDPEMSGFRIEIVPPGPPLLGAAA